MELKKKIFFCYESLDGNISIKKMSGICVKFFQTFLMTIQDNQLMQFSALLKNHDILLLNSNELDADWKDSSKSIRQNSTIE